MIADIWRAMVKDFAVFLVSVVFLLLCAAGGCGYFLGRHGLPSIEVKFK